MQTVRASERYRRAIAATSDLLRRLRLEAMYVGSVARSAWLGGRVERGSLDLIALMNEQQRNQLAMMASNRGFRIEQAEIDQSEELDLVPLNFVDPEGDVRVFVLLASNALYGRMAAARVPAMLDDIEISVPRAEDFALLLAVAEEDAEAMRDREMLIRVPGFDRHSYNERLISIGLPRLVVAE